MIRIGIAGYGNLGRGVEAAIRQNTDMELAAVFTRRNPGDVKLKTERVPVYHTDKAKDMTKDIDVMILCGGSATDLPVQGPQFAAMFNTVDSFDTHAKIPEYFAAVDAAAKQAGKTAAISIGWDPGLFSLNRAYAQSILPHGSSYTFWGKGVSQGHSDAIRRISGVKHAVQYTVPIDEAIEKVRNFTHPKLSIKEKHLRQCFVVAEKEADCERIEKEIKQMPNYFADYDTEVRFVSEEVFHAEHSAMPHGGFVMRSGKTGLDEETNQMMEFSLKLESNPEFTASVLVAYARAVYKLSKEGRTGAKTVLDIAPGDLSDRTPEALREQLL